MPYFGPFDYKLRQERCQMARPNYAFAKRQRELAKKKKKEEKRRRKEGTAEIESSEDQKTSTGDDSTEE